MKMQKNKKLVQAAAVGLSVCVLAGGGLFVWNMYGKNAEENEKQIVSDEVESLNSRDNVVDLEELFEGEKASGKEDVTSEKTEKKEDSSTKSGSSQKSDSSKQSGGAKKPESSKDTDTSKKPDKKPSKPDEKPSKPDEQPSEPDDKPSVPDEKPSVPDEKPSVPDEQPSTPQKPALPQVNEPGWITGIY